jgi:hypothetical protein
VVVEWITYGTEAAMIDDLDDDFEDEDFGDEDEEDLSDFADPGGESALRAETEDNPRNLPCPRCGEPNRLTPADRARRYVCDTCANRAERGGDY